MAGEYTGAVVIAGHPKIFCPSSGPIAPSRMCPLLRQPCWRATCRRAPSGLCTGCPERPLFASMKLLAREMGPMQFSADIGCHSCYPTPAAV